MRYISDISYARIMKYGNPDIYFLRFFWIFLDFPDIWIKVHNNIMFLNSYPISCKKYYLMTIKVAVNPEKILKFFWSQNFLQSCLIYGNAKIFWYLTSKRSIFPFFKVHQKMDFWLNILGRKLHFKVTKMALIIIKCSKESEYEVKCCCITWNFVLPQYPLKILWKT